MTGRERDAAGGREQEGGGTVGRPAAPLTRRCRQLTCSCCCRPAGEATVALGSVTEYLQQQPEVESGVLVPAAVTCPNATAARGFAQRLADRQPWPQGSFGEGLSPALCGWTAFASTLSQPAPRPLRRL